ncbi:hypothetical protein CBR_g20327 [Chara braunii]|uniref:inorganic diphosphatase n=1 Tax=Chara braunii TaxID=69332 RepID=A0A388L0I0_CHABU|nr:hypothetical protein CBR_g20327 [Chara braunii]|eukprot:GBG75703.1 hypothetical protein CBR_g20327 [Chara braunii]
MAAVRVFRVTGAPVAAAATAATRVAVRQGCAALERAVGHYAVPASHNAGCAAVASPRRHGQCHRHRQISSSSSSSSIFLAGRSLVSVLNRRLGPRRRVSLARLSIRADYQAKPEGEPTSLDFRVFLVDDDGNPVSAWHDIPLHAGDGLLNFVCEIPKESSAKMEVATDEAGTPIKQDTKKGKLRFYPYNINWNYGMLPQTWEDPSHANPDVENALGDNDPVDVVEIGEREIQMGEVVKVKPLAIYAMIDEGELDWKLVAIAADDPKAPLVNDIADVEKHFPGTLNAIRVWFRDYKIPDGKPANRFGLNDKPMGRDYALKVVEETNEFWAKLVKRTTPKGELSLV